MSDQPKTSIGLRGLQGPPGKCECKCSNTTSITQSGVNTIETSATEVINHVYGAIHPSHKIYRIADYFTVSDSTERKSEIVIDEPTDDGLVVFANKINTSISAVHTQYHETVASNAALVVSHAQALLDHAAGLLAYQTNEALPDADQDDSIFHPGPAPTTPTPVAVPDLNKFNQDGMFMGMPNAVTRSGETVELAAITEVVVDDVITQAAVDARLPFSEFPWVRGVDVLSIPSGAPEYAFLRSNPQIIYANMKAVKESGYDPLMGNRMRDYVRVLTFQPLAALPGQPEYSTTGNKTMVAGVGDQFHPRIFFDGSNYRILKEGISTPESAPDVVSASNGSQTIQQYFEFVEGLSHSEAYSGNLDSLPLKFTAANGLEFTPEDGDSTLPRSVVKYVVKLHVVVQASLRDVHYNATKIFRPVFENAFTAYIQPGKPPPVFPLDLMESEIAVADITGDELEDKIHHPDPGAEPTIPDEPPAATEPGDPPDGPYPDPGIIDDVVDGVTTTQAIIDTYDANAALWTAYDIVVAAWDLQNVYLDAVAAHAQWVIDKALFDEVTTNATFDFRASADVSWVKAKLKPTYYLLVVKQNTSIGTIPTVYNKEAESDEHPVVVDPTVIEYAAVDDDDAAVTVYRSANVFMAKQIVGWEPDVCGTVTHTDNEGCSTTSTEHKYYLNTNYIGCETHNITLYSDPYTLVDDVKTGHNSTDLYFTTDDKENVTAEYATSRALNPHKKIIIPTSTGLDSNGDHVYEEETTIFGVNSADFVHEHQDNAINIDGWLITLDVTGSGGEDGYTYIVLQKEEWVPDEIECAKVVTHTHTPPATPAPAKFIPPCLPKPVTGQQQASIATRRGVRTRQYPASLPNP
jgi:hypothetical protein